MEKDAYLQMAAQEDTHWWYVARRQVISLLFRKFLKHADANRQILDAACGTGGNLPLLAKWGKVYAFEQDKLARDHATARNLCTIEAGSFPDDIPFADGLFNLIICCDVLEHLDNDLLALESLKNKLATNGLILLTVPAYRWMWSKHDEFHHHHRRYSKAQFKQLLQNAGLQPLLLSHFNFWLFPLIILIRMIDKINTRKNAPLFSETPPTWLNSIFAKLMGSEGYLLPLFPLPFGLSIVAIAKINPSNTL